MTKDEKRANKILQDSTKFINGHYEIGLLWKSDTPKLSNNRQLAIKRLGSLERKLSKNPQLAKKYSDVLNQYIASGHATRLNPFDSNELSNIVNYIPHHCVLNPKKPNKVRVVFDAAAKFESSCLNDHLLKGPDLLNNLVTILIKFREGIYAVSSDVEQMFHQIFVSPSDKNALRFVWRESISEPPSDYVINVHTWGKNDSPCIANYALKRSASDFRDIANNPSVKESIENNFYMDDFLKSMNSLTDLSIICKSVTDVLSKASFRLRKWISNNQSIN